MKPRLLDLFCGAGGAAVGYARAGFEVVGVDIAPQPRYPFEFVQDDALETLREGLATYPTFLDAGCFDAIHASPPCQAYVSFSRHNGRHVDLIPETRELLEATGLPYVIENVEGSSLRNAAKFCGSHFGLDLRRHRLFETNWPLLSTPCAHHLESDKYPNADRGGRPLVGVVSNYGNTRYAGDFADRQRAMGIDWMTVAELAEAIPPAYTELIGHQLMQHIRANDPAAVGMRRAAR